ncbi:TPA: nucleoid-associated protein, partial [Clostridioides difficile]|nr:nucleoid-associated protein [Clostridioides difficile]
MIIHKFIIHVLDKNSDTPILNDFEGKVNQEVDGFFQKA